MAATAKTTTNDPDWTAGVDMVRTRSGLFIICDVNRFQGSPMDVERSIINQAGFDGTKVTIRLAQDPGQAGKAQAEMMVRKLAGYSVKVERPTGDKATRAAPLASQAEAGNVKLLVTGDPARDAWVAPFLDEMSMFPAGAHDDQVDAAADAFSELALGGSSYDIRALG
jgi:predicted phage terminase large subunit-like protein